MSLTTFTAATELVDGETAVINTVRNHTLQLDDPCACREKSDVGVNPIEMMLSALGSCQCLAAKQFARENQIPIHKFNIELEGDLDPDNLLHVNGSAPAGFQEVRFKTHIVTSASPEKIEQFRRFVQGQCPLSQTMLPGVSIISDDIIIELDDDAIAETYGHVMAAW